jgi:hypothetical protein
MTEEATEFVMLMWKRVLHYMDIDASAEEIDIDDMIGARSVIDIPVVADPPTEDNGNREGRTINWPALPTEE